MKHQNTFENGLNQDVNVTKQPQGTYRDLHNGMLISYDSNHYAVETALGNTVNFSIPPRYLDNTFALDTPPLPIGLISFIDKLVVFSTNDSSTNGGYGEIGTVVFNNAGNGTYTPLYHDTGLNFSKQYKIRGFTYPENDKIERVYWTDNFNEGRVINTQDPLLISSAYIPNTGPLLNGTNYMVVNGAIEYPTGSGQYYGPGLPLGNIVISTSPNTTYTIVDNGNNPTGVPIVVQYIDYHLLSFNPDRKMGGIDFVKWLSSGSLNCGAKMYFHRLGLKNAGYVTSWSYGSFPIDVNIQSVNTWKDVVGGGAGSVLTNSNKGIQIQVSNIDTAFDTIEIAVAEFDQKNDILTDAKIIISTPVTGATMVFSHFGNENVKALSVNDLTIFPASVKTFKDLCTAKNYITIANLKERDEITFDSTTITISDMVYEIPADVFGDDPNSVYQGSGYMVPASGVGLNDILPDGKYLVTGTAGSSVIYNGVTYTLGQTFAGVAPITNWAISAGNPVVQGCVILRKYTDASSNPVNKVIPILDDFWDYKGMVTTQYLRQYWTNETYRFGILFYDLKGNPYFVRWIGDKQIWYGTGYPVTPSGIPDGITNKGGLLIDRGTGHNFSLQANGLSISGINISADLASKISGFSIMRAPRDRQYLAQGLIFPVVRNKTTAANCCPMAQSQLGDDANYAVNGAPFAVYTWHSPDQLCQSSIFSASGNNKLEGENFVGSINAAIPTVAVSGGGDQQFTKYYESNPDGTQTGFSLNITDFGGVNPDSTHPVGGGSFENTFMEPAGFAPYSGGHVAVGGNCVLLQTQGGIQYAGTDIANTPNQYVSAKPIANYKVTKGSLYGGTTADAIANTPFISTGHFQEINSTVLANLPTVTISGTSYYQFNDVEVFGGDSFVSIFDHAKSLYDDRNDPSPGSYGYGIFFPVESSINHSMRQGRTLARCGMQVNNPGPLPNPNDEGIWWNFNSSTNLESFSANDAYTSDGDVFQYPALPSNFTITGKFPFRFRWGGPKIAGEIYDTFRTFLVNNFRDVDGHRGQINNVASKNGKVIYWQDQGIGTVPILERQTVTGSLGEATQLGVGGVIDRFDEYDTYFGNQHQNSLVDTEYGFSWFDMRRRAWLVMNTNGAAEEISVAKGLQSFFNSVFDNQTFANSIISVDKPLIGIGIHGVYDSRFKTTLLTFKNFRPNTDFLPYVNYDFTVGYNHVRNVIIGFFPGMTPAIWHQHNRQLLSAKNTTGVGIVSLNPYHVGNEVPKDGSQYVNIEDFTTHLVIQPFEEPDLGGSLLWTKMYSENEIYTSWTGDVCKHYGRVYPFIHEVIINPETQEAFTVDNLQIKSSIDQNFDSVVCTTDNDTAQDINLNRGDRNYRVRDNAWESNLPLGRYGRLTDYYLRIRFTLNNYLTNPTVSKNLKKVTAFINSVYRIRY